MIADNKTKENKLNLEMFSLTGELLIQLDDIDYKTKINTGNLLAGVYLLRVSTNKEVVHQEKVVIIK